jgi:hypothetical protein
VLELSKPIKNIYTSTFQQCIPSTSTTSSTLQLTVKQNHGHFVSQSLCVQLWSELEPAGIILKPSINSIWIPHPLASGETPLLDIAFRHFDCAQTAMINRCRIFLQVISTFDLLIFGTDSIHPAYLEGQLPNSRKSTITWPIIPVPLLVTGNYGISSYLNMYF